MKPSRPKALISWSSGKDSAFALYEVRRAGEFDVVGTLTTVTETFGRVSIHGVRQEILRAQCEAAGLPQRIVPIPYPCPNEVYEARMGEAVAGVLLRSGVTPPFRQVALPDEFLETGALPTLHDRYGISADAMVTSIKGWL